jgi:hypothetical protein
MMTWDIDVAAKAGVGIMLASHTHEWQFWTFGCLVRLSHPFLAGRYGVNRMTVIVVAAPAVGDLACACGNEGR